jgi:hypothetical protein
MDKNDVIKQLQKIADYCSWVPSYDKDAITAAIAHLSGGSANDASRSQGEAVACGIAGELPGTNGGFTQCVFTASDVPCGTKLYTAPQVAVTDEMVDRALAAAMEASDNYNDECIAKGMAIKPRGEEFRITMRAAITAALGSKE